MTRPCALDYIPITRRDATIRLEYRRCGHAASYTGLPEVGPVAFRWTRQEGRDPLVDSPTQPADPASRNAGQAIGGQKAFDREKRDRQALEGASTRASILRVETPPIQVARITTSGGLAKVPRDSRKPGTDGRRRSFGTRRREAAVGEWRPEAGRERDVVLRIVQGGSLEIVAYCLPRSRRRLGSAEVETMSIAISVATRRRYGIAAVHRVPGVARAGGLPSTASGGPARCSSAPVKAGCRPVRGDPAGAHRQSLSRAKAIARTGCDHVIAASAPRWNGCAGRCARTGRRPHAAPSAQLRRHDHRGVGRCHLGNRRDGGGHRLIRPGRRPRPPSTIVRWQEETSMPPGVASITRPSSRSDRACTSASALSSATPQPVWLSIRLHYGSPCMSPNVEAELHRLVPWLGAPSAPAGVRAPDRRRPRLAPLRYPEGEAMSAMAFPDFGGAPADPARPRAARRAAKAHRAARPPLPDSDATERTIPT